jgi:predicted AlkP superfamily pyrophosphatase or phosphodiesterase
MARPLPGLMDLAHSHGLKSAMIHNWEPLRDLNRPETLDVSFFANRSYEVDGDDLIAEEAVRLIPKHQPDFAFVYLGTVDTRGHMYGWMSDGYFRQIERVDGALGVVLNALPSPSNVVLQADHGGHDRTHGTEMPEDMTIPWLVAGPAIKQNYAIQAPVSLLDTAPTLARLLELPAHPQWEGKVVEEAFIQP